MIIKSFSADSAATALKKVREEMGRDAIVLSTRQLNSGSNRRGIEITACIDRPTVAQVATIIPSTLPTKPSFTKSGPDRPAAKTPQTNNRIGTVGVQTNGVDLEDRTQQISQKLDRLLHVANQTGTEGNTFGPFGEIFKHLKEADLSEQFLKQLMTVLLKGYDDSYNAATFARKKLVDHLSSLMLPSLSFKPGDRLVFIGPAGAGKSSVMGKLAARLVAQERQKVNLASLDYYKMAAHDELASYAEILDVNISGSLDDLTPQGSYENCITLIDGPALPTDPEKLERLKDKIEKINPGYRFAIFSAPTRSSDITDMAKRMETLKPTHVVVTMLDQTSRYGSAVAAAEASGVKIAFVSDSPGGMGEVKAPDPDAMARALLRMEVNLE